MSKEVVHFGDNKNKKVVDCEAKVGHRKKTAAYCPTVVCVCVFKKWSLLTSPKHIGMKMKPLNHLKA